jgi:phosphoribosylaminoimidazole (AIR) synthetase
LPIKLEGWWEELFYMTNMQRYDFESVFNCGWGMLLVISNDDVTNVLEKIKDAEAVGTIINEEQ